MKYRNLLTNKEEGFSLIETLVAITILLVAVGSPLSIASRGLFTSNVARDQIVAFYLTQDAIEYVRSVRDTNFLSSSSWLTGLSDCLNGNKCTVDTTTPEGVVTACPSGVCPPLNFDYDPVLKVGSRFYGYNDTTPGRSWPESRFTRTVEIVEIGPGGHEARVEVTIQWRIGSINRSFTAYEVLFDW